MSRFRHMDIIVEMIELCHERMDEMRQQLVYHRASVYKGETAAVITGQVEALRLLVALLKDDGLAEAFHDFDALARCILAPVPGECSFAARVTSLMGALQGGLDRVARQVLSHAVPLEGETEFAQSVRDHRVQLLALCRQGSRQWAFFHTL